MQPSTPCPSTPNPPTQPLARHLATASSNTTATRTRGQWRCDVGGESRRALIFSLDASPINAFSSRSEPAWLVCAQSGCSRVSARAARVQHARFLAERETPRAVPNANAPLQSDAVFALIGLGNRAECQLETVLFRCSQHDFCSYMQFLFLPFSPLLLRFFFLSSFLSFLFFLFLPFFLCSRFQPRLYYRGRVSRSRRTGKRKGTRTNGRTRRAATPSWPRYTRSIGAFILRVLSTRSPSHVFPSTFRLCFFSPRGEKNMTRGAILGI